MTASTEPLDSELLEEVWRKLNAGGATWRRKQVVEFLAAALPILRAWDASCRATAPRPFGPGWHTCRRLAGHVESIHRAADGTQWIAPARGAPADPSPSTADRDSIG